MAKKTDDQGRKILSSVEYKDKTRKGGTLVIVVEKDDITDTYEAWNENGGMPRGEINPMAKKNLKEIMGYVEKSLSTRQRNLKIPKRRWFQKIVFVQAD